MAEDIRVLPMAEGEYAVEIDQGAEVTHHRVTGVHETQDEFGLLGSRDETLVAEAMRFLLQHGPATALPHDIDLVRVAHGDGRFAPELRARLS